MAKPSGRRFAFSAFVFDTGTGELSRAGKRLRIPDQAARLLSALLENPGAMVSREELRDLLWPEGELLDYDRSINRTISQLRTILHDHASKSAPLIDTLPKRGYRFAAQVKEVVPEAAPPLAMGPSLAHFPPEDSASEAQAPGEAPAPRSLTPSSSSKRRIWQIAVAGIAVLCLVMAAIFFYRTRLQNQAALSLGIAAFESDGDGAQALADSFRLNLADVLAQSPQIETRSVHAFDHLGTDESAVIGRAHQLGVDLLLFGRLRLHENRCDLRLELVRTADGAHLGSFQYSGTEQELAAITDRVEQDLFERLRPGITRAGQQLGRPSNTAAYASYLRGRALLYAWTDDSLRQAVSAFQESLRLDPSYARAYAGLANTYFVLAQHGAGNSTLFMEDARTAATHALSLDPMLPEAHAMLGQVLAQKDWNFPAADAQLNRAIELDPHHASYRQWLAVSYGEEGHFKQALDEIDKAHAADPGWAPLYMTEIYLAGSSRDFIRAEQAAALLIQKMPNWPLAHEQVASLYWQEGKFLQAIAEWRRAAEIEQNTDRMRLEDQGSVAFRAGGVKAYARLRLAAMASGKGVSHAEEDFNRAEWQAYAGEYDLALDELERQVAARDPAVLQIATNSAYIPLHENPRYKAILRSIGNSSGLRP